MPWVLALHLFGVIFWLGGLLVIASLLALVPGEVGVAKERLIAAARRLLLGCDIGAAAAVVFGIALIPFEPEVLRQGWLHVKILLVAILLILHFRLYRRVAALARQPDSATAREFRMLHGIVSLLLLATLVLALLKPF